MDNNMVISNNSSDVEELLKFIAGCLKNDFYFDSFSIRKFRYLKD